MQIVIDIPKNLYKAIVNSLDANEAWSLRMAVAKGTALPEGHSFIAICDSDYPMTEEIKQKLKNTVFISDEDCSHCFDMTEIIETDKEQ